MAAVEHDPWKGTALRIAHSNPYPDFEWPPNAGHRYTVRTMDKDYYADEVTYDKLTGYPTWKVTRHGIEITNARLENALVTEYKIL